MNQMHVAAGVLTAISVIYFLADPISPLRFRLLESGHGVLFSGAMYAAIGYDRFKQVRSFLGRRIFGLFWSAVNLLGFGLVVYSLFNYGGPKWIHFSLVLFPPILVLMILFGAFVVSGDTM